MPVTHLSCRKCGTDQPLDGIGTCPRCFGPLDPIYDFDELRRTLTRERIERGPASLWRYEALLPVAPPAEPRLAPGFTPLVAVPRLSEELGLDGRCLKADNANPTLSVMDRLHAVGTDNAH